MSLREKDTALLIDGGYIRNTFEQTFTPKGSPKVHINVTQVIKNAHKICEPKKLFRIYYYDATPFDGKRRNPISNREIDFKASAGFTAINQFQHDLARSERVAFRSGHLSFKGWKYRNDYDFKKTPSDTDIMPILEQKTVDIKIGLDIAWIAIKKIVDRIIILTADSDFIPVMKFARKEGLEVILCGRKSDFRKEMLEHADEFIELKLVQ